MASAVWPFKPGARLGDGGTIPPLAFRHSLAYNAPRKSVLANRANPVCLFPLY